MSRKRIKQEFCINCGTKYDLSDNYCKNCGQENHSPNQPIKHLILELFEAITHLDSKVFLTYKNLFINPGKYSMEYIGNMRNRYVHPVRLFIFTSAVFFFLLQYNAISKLKDQSFEFRDVHRDTSLIVNKDSSKLGRLYFDTLIQDKRKPLEITIDTNYLSLTSEVIDSLEKLDQSSMDHFIKLKGLPVNFFTRQVYKQSIKTIKEGNNVKNEFIQKGLKYISISLFLLMPVFAFFLYLMYIRNKRNYYEYLIISVNYHTLYFTVLILFILISMIGSFSYVGFLAVIFLLFIYLVKGLRRNFNQSWRKTIIKAFVVNVLYSMVLFISVMICFFLGWLLF